VAVDVDVGQEAETFELLGVEEMGLVQDEDDVAASFLLFGSERFGGLGDERGAVKARCSAEGGHDRGVEAAGPD